MCMSGARSRWPTGKAIRSSTFRPAGRGLQQTLLILAYLYASPGNVLLLDEPDAHLEILRQRQIYGLLSETAERSGGQVVAASHSEVLLNEAADKDLVIAFVGRPHVLGGRTSQLRKSLAEIGWDQYYQAEQKGWVLYLEGSTDLAILRAFARRLDHKAAVRRHLQQPFVHYCGNRPGRAQSHFHGLAEAVPDLKGLALFDRLDSQAATGAWPVDPRLAKEGDRELFLQAVGIGILGAHAACRVTGRENFLQRTGRTGCARR